MAVTQEEFESAISVVEIYGVYDGWSIAILPGRVLKNRWAEDDGSCVTRRAIATQKVIDEMQAAIDAAETPIWELKE